MEELMDKRVGGTNILILGTTHALTHRHTYMHTHTYTHTHIHTHTYTDTHLSSAWHSTGHGPALASNAISSILTNNRIMIERKK